ncbi:MAG: Aminoglycoside phosphotransferase [Rhodoglobus sp.]|nr:Aminoglycoside phosphotransferase [Rhodoglobus sp.]
MIIDAALASRLVAQQFPQWAHLAISEPDVQGNDNRTYRLGSELSVRLPSAEGYVAQVEKEQRWLPVLAPELPLPVAKPVAMGWPSELFAWPWSVYRWIEGSVASRDRIGEPSAFAAELAAFLTALQAIDATGGPPAGAQSFFRGGDLRVYDRETRDSIALLADRIDAQAALAAWNAALSARWSGRPRWVHGDIAPANLLVRDGRLAAVIDFGCSAIGDPACDLAIAWTFLSGESRQVFRELFPGDEAMWARGRGWALWKALITIAAGKESSPIEAPATRVVDDVIADVGRV